MNAPKDQGVVVTGMGLVSPLGSDLQQVWSRLAAGYSGIGRWNGVWGGFMEGLPVALSCPYKEDQRRAVRFALDAALGALSDAGLDGAQSMSRSHDLSRIGLALGSSKGNMLALEKALSPEGAGIGPDTLGDFFHHSANAMVMSHTGICGPCISLVSACSTGANCIVQGTQWILDDQADMVLAGAAESSFTRLVLSGFKRMGVLAQAGPNEDPRSVSRPFDRRRSGFVIGEGAGVVCLERRSHALARGARIYAQISGWGMAGDAHKSASFHPQGDSIVRAAQTCARRTGIEVSAMDYIHCHGTGTLENDRIEAKALSRLLMGSAGQGPQHTALDSTKPMTGHLLGAAGSVEFILTTLALTHDFVPPTLNLEEPDDDCDLDFTARIGYPKKIEHAMMLSYGFGGHVTAIAIKKR